MREVDLLDHLQLLSRPTPSEVVAHSPPHPFQHRRFPERGGEERARRSWLWECLAEQESILNIEVARRRLVNSRFRDFSERSFS